ncbi:hypothetical protein J6590_040307 [Homalodisca vitripennis]|nr:hypothetical protein J6590_040307 [Homalodisca vitripennis]
MSKEEYTGKFRSWTCTDCEESGLINTEIATQLTEDKITVERPDVTILALLNEMREFRSEANRDKDLEISGVPFMERENLIGLIGRISEVIGFTFNENMIDNVFRYKGAGTKLGNIVVRFVRKLDKEAMVTKRR